MAEIKKIGFEAHVIIDKHGYEVSAILKTKKAEEMLVLLRLIEAPVRILHYKEYEIRD